VKAVVLRQGDRVATAMGGMGRDFDGGYAEYTCVPAKQVQVCIFTVESQSRPRATQSADLQARVQNS